MSFLRGNDEQRGETANHSVYLESGLTRDDIGWIELIIIKGSLYN